MKKEVVFEIDKVHVTVTKDGVRFTSTEDKAKTVYMPSDIILLSSGILKTLNETD